MCRPEDKTRPGGCPAAPRVRSRSREDRDTCAAPYVESRPGETSAANIPAWSPVCGKAGVFPAMGTRTRSSLNGKGDAAVRQIAFCDWGWGILDPPPERLTQQPPADGNPFRIEPPYHRGDSRNGTKRFPNLRMPRIVPSNCRLRLDGPPVFPYSTANSRYGTGRFHQAIQRPRIVPCVYDLFIARRRGALSAKDG